MSDDLLLANIVVLSVMRCWTLIYTNIYTMNVCCCVDMLHLTAFSYFVCLWCLHLLLAFLIEEWIIGMKKWSWQFVIFTIQYHTQMVKEKNILDLGLFIKSLKATVRNFLLVDCKLPYHMVKNCEWFIFHFKVKYCQFFYL